MWNCSFSLSIFFACPVPNCLQPSRVEICFRARRKLSSNDIKKVGICPSLFNNIHRLRRVRKASALKKRVRQHRKMLKKSPSSLPLAPGGVVAAATKKDHTTTTHSWEGSETLPAGFMEHERLASQALAQCIGMKTRSAAEFKAEFCENDKTEWTADKFTFTDHCNDWADLCSSNCTNGMATCPQDFDNQQRDCCNPGRPRSTLVEQVKSNVEQVKESMGFNSNTLNF